MASAAQDMPPPGGYQTIKVGRTFAKPLVKQGIWFLTAVGVTINGLNYIREHRRQMNIGRIEKVESYIAVIPFIYAEQERLFLRQLRILREEERELMKNHPGWKLATLYGEPVYKTLPKDYLPPIHALDYTAHRSQTEWFEKVCIPDSHT